MRDDGVIDTPHSKFLHLYAIVRIDLSMVVDSPENGISVVKVFSSKLSAQQEVSRLNQLNSKKGYLYVMNITRLAFEE